MVFEGEKNTRRGENIINICKLASLGASTRSTTTSVASRNDACYASTTIE
jgi:hypothetical protein